MGVEAQIPSLRGRATVGTTVEYHFISREKGNLVNIIAERRAVYLIAQLFSPDQSAGRRYCKVKKREAAVQKQFGMNISAVPKAERTRSAQTKFNPNPDEKF